VDRPPSGKVSEPVGGRDKPGAVSGTVAAPMVIGENDESDDDDGMIITAETAGPDQPAAAAQEHGGLVADLLDAQKAQTAEEEARKAQVAQQDAVPASQPGGGGIIIQRKIGKQGGKENYGNEVKTLRESIQRLCQFTNPLGKTMDYIQEDLVNMQKELEQWKNER
jgi:TRAF3-interacting protein 1